MVMTEIRKPPRVLVIAGSDSSGGAGIQADIKTITMLSGYAMTAITAITAQNTIGVQAVKLLDPELVGAQIDSCVSDIGVDVVKIGMLGSPDIAAIVADRLDALDVPIVFDPVMVATSGAALADDQTIAEFERLMRLATLVTPNIAELERLTGTSDIAGEGMVDAARLLSLRYKVEVLAKGGTIPPIAILRPTGCLAPMARPPRSVTRDSTPFTPTVRAALWPARSPACWGTGKIWTMPSGSHGNSC